MVALASQLGSRAVKSKTAPTDSGVTGYAQKAKYLSHFTPSMMSPETLEAMFVKREALLARCVNDVATSVLTDAKLHHLYIGSRGIGKTHLISLLHHRLSQRQDVMDRALIAWMREEEWGITNFFEFILRILRTLDQTYPTLNLAPRVEGLYSMSQSQAAELAPRILLEVLGDKTLVILVENIDDLFDQIGDAGQKALRTFIQNHSKFSIIATSPAIFRGISLQSSPFFGFFQNEVLERLDFEEVLLLLEKIATDRGDAILAEYIQSPEGRARVRAVHHLAEGNPRIYIIFAQFLTKEALDELVTAFMHTLDELTPYYQARMKELPGQQRKILEYLIQYRGAAQVKKISQACFITHQVCSSQLKQLKDKSYVQSTALGRESFYELSEPLMRLCMEVKRQRGEPVSLFVELLQIWYSVPELEAWVADPSRNTGLSSAYLQSALEALKTNNTDPKLGPALKDFDLHLAAADWSRGVSVLEEIQTLGVNIDRLQYLLLLECVRHTTFFSQARERTYGHIWESIRWSAINVDGKGAESALLTVALASLAVAVDKQFAVPNDVLGLVNTAFNKHPRHASSSFLFAVTLFAIRMRYERVSFDLSRIEAWLKAQSTKTTETNINKTLDILRFVPQLIDGYIAELDVVSKESSLLQLPIEMRKLLKGIQDKAP
jgi:hypothetical protein